MVESTEDIGLGYGAPGAGGNIGFVPLPPDTTTTGEPLSADYFVNYEIVFASNFQNEIGNLLKLKYEIVSDDSTITTDAITLADYNTDGLSTLKSNLTNSTLRIYVEGTLPNNYKILKIFYANRQVAEKNSKDVSKWTVGDKVISVPATELLTGGFAVSVVMEKTILAPQPIVSIKDTKYDYNVKDSDLDTIVNVPFNSSNADFVDFYLNSNSKIRVDATKGFIDFSFKKDFAGIYGSKKLIVVPYSDAYGTGNKAEIIVNFNSVNDFPSITQIIFPDVIDVPSFSDLNLDVDVEWNSFAVSSVDIDLIAKDKSRIKLFKSLPANGKVKINLKDLTNKFPTWSGSDNVTIVLKPYNRSGAVELVGNEYEIKTFKNNAKREAPRITSGVARGKNTKRFVAALPLNLCRVIANEIKTPNTVETIVTNNPTFKLVPSARQIVSSLQIFVQASNEN